MLLVSSTSTKYVAAALSVGPGFPVAVVNWNPGPAGPVSPFGHCTPAGPVSPVGRCGPVGPGAPAAPCGPARELFGLEAVGQQRVTLDVDRGHGVLVQLGAGHRTVFELCRADAVRGSVIAAYAPPAKEMNRATSATAIARDGRPIKSR